MADVIDQYDQVIERLKAIIDLNKQYKVKENNIKKRRDDLDLAEAKLKIKIVNNNEEKKKLLKKLTGKEFEDEVILISFYLNEKCFSTILKVGFTAAES